MSIKALQEYTRYAKYAKYLPEKKRRETWEEQINRVFNMHEQHLGDKIKDIKEDFDFAKEMVMKKRVLGSQRALQFGGKAILDKNARLYNCSATYIDRPRAFQESLYLLLCGVGVGFSVQYHHVNKLPNIKKRTNKENIFIIPDTIEGWADALGILVSSYFESCDLFTDYNGKKVIFDYSSIRPKGAKLSWGGKAPGPLGLKSSLEKIEQLFERCLSESKSKLDTIDVYDILMHASDAVLSGGVRRSATICIFSPNDEKMAKAKIGDWFKTNPQRGRSNNSALLIRNETTKEHFSEIMKSVKDFGEPGFIWADDKESLFNPCLTDDVWITTDNGAKQIKDLIGIPFTAVVNGKKYKSTKRGFFKTGTRDVIKLMTKEGFYITATNNHKLMINNGGNDEWVEINDIKENDMLVIHNHFNNTWCGKGTFQEGWLLGNLLGDGNVEKKYKRVNLDYWGETKHFMVDRAIEFAIGSGLGTKENVYSVRQTPSVINKVEKLRISNKKLFDLVHTFDMDTTKKASNKVEQASSDFYKGFLQGWFDADGSIQGTQQKGISVRLSSIDNESLIVAQRMLLRLGIFSKIYKNRKPAGLYMLPDSNGNYKEYNCQAIHELIISKKSIVKFYEIINFSDPLKTERLNKIIKSYKRRISDNKFVATVLSKEVIGRKPVYDCTIPDIHCFDANGIMTHNCVEISMYAKDEEGNSGWEFCNLCEINVKKCKDENDFYDACRAASILGTIQASYSSFPYLGEITERIVKKEALIGVSMTGVMDKPEIALNEKIQKLGANTVRKINKEISNKIGINQAARTTCLKPAGSTSCLLGTSSGIHPGHAKRYLRRVQANKIEYPVNYFKMFNPLSVEESVWSTNKTDLVITFVCEVPDGAIVKNMVSAIDLLKNVKLTQQNWVEYGTNESLSSLPSLRHNVSNTITVKPDEWEEVTEFIYANRSSFAGISLLPSSGDLDYPQAPFTTIHTPAEIVKIYGDGSLMASGLIVDGLRVFDNNLWLACDTVMGIGDVLELTDEQKKLKNGQLKKIVDMLEQKEDWVRRAKQFADRYFDKDVKKMSHCLKEVHNWKYFCDLKREYMDVDWSMAVEDEYNIDTTTLAGDACSGGKCEMK